MRSEKGEMETMTGMPEQETRVGEGKKMDLHVGNIS